MNMAQLHAQVQVNRIGNVHFDYHLDSLGLVITASCMNVQYRKIVSWAVLEHAPDKGAMATIVKTREFCISKIMNASRERPVQEPVTWTR